MAAYEPMPNNQPSPETIDRILATVYGQCIGDAIGLLSEFLTKEETKESYEAVSDSLEYCHKSLVSDLHRARWKEGDWTDDTDQMILIMRSLVDTNGKPDHNDFAKKLLDWIHHGFPELGDHAGLGQGATTAKVVKNKHYLDDPHGTAEKAWEGSERTVAPNGGVMRTSFVGVHMFWDLDLVKQNAINLVKITHFDPRCQASAVAVSVAIATMLQGKHKDKKGHFVAKEIIKDSYKHASECLTSEDQKKELKTFMKCTNIKDLKLDEEGKIGYTYKSMGSGFWALKQDNFRKAVTKIMMQGGDADSNACVAGALLGCKLGLSALPDTWVTKLRYKSWLDKEIQRYFSMMRWTVHHKILEEVKPDLQPINKEHN